MDSTVVGLTAFLGVVLASVSALDVTGCGNSMDDFFTCLKVRTVRLLDRAITSDSLPLTEYLTVNMSPGTKDLVLTPLPVNFETALPRNLDAKNSVLDQMLTDRIANFLETRTITLSMPKDEVEGRKKKGGKKKKGLILLLIASKAVILLKLAMAGLALLVGKALLVSKIALLVAGGFGLSMLLAKGLGGHQTPPIVYTSETDIHHGGGNGGDWSHVGGSGGDWSQGGSIGSGWSRNAIDSDSAQDLAYKRQRSLQS